MESVGLEAHFLATNYPADSYELDEAFQKRMDVWKEREEKWKEGARAWKKENSMAKAALGGVIPDSIYMEASERKQF